MRTETEPKLIGTAIFHSTDVLRFASALNETILFFKNLLVISSEFSVLMNSIFALPEIAFSVMFAILAEMYISSPSRIKRGRFGVTETFFCVIMLVLVLPIFMSLV